MIRESRVDPNLNRLSTVFGSSLIIRPPASTEDIAKLQSLAGPLPREYAIFLLTCDGLRIRSTPAERAPAWHLWHVQEMVASILNPQGVGTPCGLLPFCGDGAGTRDCLVTGHGPAEGAVVRWDPLSREVELACSGFGHYLDRWTEFMVEVFAREPSRRATPKAMDFEVACLQIGDPRLASLRDSTTVMAWLHELDHIVASGDDFE